MFFSKTLIFLAALPPLAYVSFNLPEGSADGIYRHVNVNGTDALEFVQSIDPSMLEGPAPPSRVMDRQDGGTGTLHCQGDILNLSDEAYAISALASGCATGTTFSNKGDHRGLTANVNTVVAFSCTYGGSQTCIQNAVAGYMGQITNGCGSRDGYYSITNWKLSYGVVPSTGSWC
jgi:hypothetical protein